MDKTSVGTQCIICECGDNFPNEKLLNIHLANDHADVETYQCEYCPELLTSAELYERHIRQHNGRKQKKQTQNDPSLINSVKKSLPDIKVQIFKRIDAISSTQGLKVYGGLLKVPCPTREATILNQPVEAQVEPEMAVEETAELVNAKNEILQDETLHCEQDEEIYYQCDVCKKIFKTEDDFNIHYQLTHALKTVVTLEDLPKDHSMSDHIDSVNIKTEVEGVESAKYYVCEICHKLFVSEEFFTRHYNKVHANKSSELIKENIQEPPGDTQEESLQTESQDVSIEASQDTQDPIEVTKTESIQLEEAKLSPKAPEQVVYFKCDLCKVLYPTEKAYIAHLKKKHGGAQGFEYIEQDLERNYPAPAATQDEYSCEICFKTFNVKRYLQEHQKRMHPGRPPPAAPGDRAKATNRSKVCNVCGRAFNSNTYLVYHQRTHTGEKPYQCSECPKRFSVHQLLKLHLRTHTGERPFKCTLCPKAFKHKTALNVHDRVHSGVKPYSCEHCGKSFSQSSSKKLHVNTVHLKLPTPYKHRRNKNV